MSLEPSSILGDPERLRVLRSSDLLGTPAEEAFDRLSRLATRLIGVPTAFVSLLDDRRHFFKSCIGLGEPWNSWREMPLSQSFCRHTVESGEPLVIEDSRVHPRVRDIPEIEALGIVAYAGIPLVTDAGHVLGSFCAADGVPRPWTDGEVGILRDLAASVMTEIELRLEIAERRAQEARLRDAERGMLAMADAAPDAIVIVDAHGVVRFANAAVERVLGHPPAEVTGGSVDVLLGPGLTGRFRDKALRYLDTRTRTMPWAGVRVSARHRDGREIPAELSFSEVEQGGETLFLAIVRDLRERLAAEEALRRSEEHFRSLVMNIHDLVAVLDAGGRPVFVSPSVRRVLGYLPEEFLAISMAELVHPEDYPLVETAMAEVVAAPGTERTIEIRARHADGSWRFLQSHGNALPPGMAPGIVIISARDITDRRRLEQELEDRVAARTRALSQKVAELDAEILERERAQAALRESQDQLLQAQKMEAIGRLAGGVAHDFNNLLTVIIGNAQMALMDLPSDPGPQVRAELEDIERVSRRAAALTRQLLAFSRRQTLDPHVVDVGQVLRGMETIFRRVLGEDVALHTRVDPGTTVLADPSQLEQVIMNLVVNARDAMPTGGTLSITVGGEEVSAAQLPPGHPGPPGSYVAMRVADTGHGMDAHTLAHIYEPFFTTKEAGRGTGLGLPTVHGIVQQSGGWIHVESRPGAGTTFRIYWPGASDAAPEAEPEPPRAPATGTETVLVVEDESALRALVRTMLRRHGYTVLEAADGVQALRLAEGGGAVDLLLTDVVMPGMSGRALADRLAELRPGVRVLYMSGYTDETVAPHGVVAPGARLLHKPFTPAELAERVRAALEGAG